MYAKGLVSRGEELTWTLAKQAIAEKRLATTSIEEVELLVNTREDFQKGDHHMSAQDNVTLIHTLVQAFNSHDADPFAANATEDCEILDVASGMTLSGPEGWRQFNQGFITAFPDGQIQATNVFTTDDQGVFEFTGRGTNTGPFPSPAGQIPPTGRRSEQRFCAILRFRNGKVASVHYYYDLLGWLQQLGLIPQQG